MLNTIKKFNKIQYHFPSNFLHSDTYNPFLNFDKLFMI
jgi:hypothetical protein